jgi:hypothetical protein
MLNCDENKYLSPVACWQFQDCHAPSFWGILSYYILPDISVNLCLHCIWKNESFLVYRIKDTGAIKEGVGPQRAVCNQWEEWSSKGAVWGNPGGMWGHQWVICGPKGAMWGYQGRLWGPMDGVLVSRDAQGQGWGHRELGLYSPKENVGQTRKDMGPQRRIIG